MGRPCRVPECNKWSVKGGTCRGHAGSELPPTLHELQLVAKLEVIAKAVHSTSEMPCVEWPWPNSTNNRPRMQMNGRQRLVTHIVMEEAGQPRPEPPFDKALHDCDNDVCIAAGHLYWGDDQDNSNDRFLHG